MAPATGASFSTTACPPSRPPSARKPLGTGCGSGVERPHLRDSVRQFRHGTSASGEGRSLRPPLRRCRRIPMPGRRADGHGKRRAPRAGRHVSLDRTAPPRQERICGCQQWPLRRDADGQRFDAVHPHTCSRREHGRAARGVDDCRPPGRHDERRILIGCCLASSAITVGTTPLTFTPFPIPLSSTRQLP